MHIRYATDDDNESLTRLAALTPMEGSIGLRIDREPDFFGLLGERGEYKVWIAEDETGEITGSFSATKIPFYIRHRLQWIHYLGDLRIHPRHRGSSLAYRLVKKVHAQLLQDSADLLFCTAAHGNSAVMEFFTGRAGIPAFRQVATFIAYQLIPRRLREPAETNLFPPDGLTAFYDEFYRLYMLRPAIGPLDDCIHLTSTTGQTIRAALSVYDPSSLKQLVVLHYPPATAIALAGLRMIRPSFRLPPIPRKGEPLKILYVKYLGYAPSCQTDLGDLIRQLRHYAFIQGYHLVSIAVDDKDRELKKIIRPQSRLTFRSIGLMTSLQNNMSLVDDIAAGILYEDFSLV